MFFNYGYKVSKILSDAEKERYNLSHPYVGTEHLLLSILKSDEQCTKAFLEFNVDYNTFKKTLIDVVGKSSKKQEMNLYTPLLKRVIEGATDTAMEEKREVSAVDLVLSLLEEAEGIAFRLLISLDVDPDLLYKKLKKTINNNNLIALDIGTNLNKTVDMSERIVGRDAKINDVIEILLRKKKNNPILVGKAGVGKTAIAYELARRINSGNVPLSLKNKQIISIEMGTLLAGTKYRGEFEERLTKLVDEIINRKDIILFIDEIHTIANAGGSEGAINASDILKPYMARGDIKIIGATTEEEYEKYIIKDKALERRFEKILIEEPSLEEMNKLMMIVKKEYEKYHNVIISDEVIKYLVKSCDLYITNKNNPDKTIEMLDTVCSHVNLNNRRIYKDENKLMELKTKYLKEKNYKKAAFYLKKRLDLLNNKHKTYITKKDILEVIINKNNIPSIKELSTLKKHITNEDVLNILENKYQNINDLKSILLVGDYNNILNSIINYYNPKIKPIIIDLNEYNNSSKLLGVSAGYVGYNDNYALKSIINNPYSLVIFKNIDKAKKELLNIIKKVLKEGFITNGKGEKLDFTKSLIIATKDIDKTKIIGFNNQNIINDESGFTNVINILEDKIEIA